LQGNWKLIRFKYKGKAERFELYNIVDDIGETKDLAAENPAKVKSLKAIMVKAKTPAENKEFDWSDTEK